jgi:hypothetical protein
VVERGVFQALYDSGWHHPLACLVATLLSLVALAVRRPALWKLALVLQLEIALDALLTGAWSPLEMSAAPAQLLAVLFVLVGDWRWYFLLLRQGLPRAPAAGAALAASMMVPVLAFVARAALPRLLGSTRALLLLYEVLFALVALTAIVLIRRGADGPVKRYLLRLAIFELAQYGGWAIADALIVGVGDVGYLVRVVPSLLYYAAFVPFAWLSAPREARA